MPEEILLFVIRIFVLAVIAGVIYTIITQVIIPLVTKQPIFPLINHGGSVLEDVRRWQRQQLEDELADKKNEVELARLEAEIAATRRKIDEERARSAGDNLK